jgi:hypothetical protein
MSGPGIVTPTADDNLERPRQEQDLLDAALAGWRGWYPDVTVVSEASSVIRREFCSTPPRTRPA